MCFFKYLCGCFIDRAVSLVKSNAEIMEIGNYNDLKVSRATAFGVYLVDDQGSEVLLPKRYVTGAMPAGMKVRVFVYNDSENRPVATTETPTAVVGQTALLRVKAVNAVGAFMDWGLVAKDLLVPFGEQRVDMKAGRSYVVHVYLDRESGRIVASAKLDKFLSHDRPGYYHRQRVQLLVVQRNELGFKVIVNDSHWGMIYHNEIMCDVNIGDRLTGYVKQVRDDDKVDVTLAKIEKARVDDLSALILGHLKGHGGTMSLTDKSSPEEIFKAFGCSKKDFKKALGLLYKQQRVELLPDCTRLKH